MKIIIWNLWVLSTTSTDQIAPMASFLAGYIIKAINILTSAWHSIGYLNEWKKYWHENKTTLGPTKVEEHM